MYLARILATALTLFSVSPLLTQQDTPPPSDSAAQAPTSTPAENTPSPPANQTQPATQKEAPKKKRPATAKVRKRRAHKPATAPGEPRKIVVHQGGASEPAAQIVPGVTQEEASHQRQTAEQLFASTETNLKQLAARTLTATQQETIGQIRHYMAGTRSALKDGDTQRARTLALKAHLLSDDLVKH
jgi:hypothetical protein